MSVFDRAHFDAMTGGDRALQVEVIGLFRDQVGAWEQALFDDARRRDAAHTIKGSARGLGLWALARACEAAEIANGAGADEARAAVVSALHEALAALAAYERGVS
jgi:HPt (histidine-containing phosphotransfer) domain-containing protein